VKDFSEIVRERGHVEDIDTNGGLILKLAL
jgi:hypothetical protein